MLYIPSHSQPESVRITNDGDWRLAGVSRCQLNSTCNARRVDVAPKARVGHTSARSRLTVQVDSRTLGRFPVPI